MRGPSTITRPPTRTVWGGKGLLREAFMERFSAEATWLRGDNVHVNNSNESTELT